MTNAMSKYTDLYPKRADITGSHEQAFGLNTKFTQTIINSIKANTVAAIGIVATGSLQVQYIFAPKVFTKPDGTPVSILGNASNVMGEFALTSLPLASITLFPCVIQKEDGCALSQGKDLTDVLLQGTSWHNDGETYACVAVPNVFFVYFGQSIPTGRISSDATKAAFKLLGPGYDSWVTIAAEAIEVDENMDKVFDNGSAANGGKFDAFVTEFFTNDRAKSGLPITRAPPTLSLTSVQSDEYPATAMEIKKEYSQVTTQSVIGQAATTLIVQHSSEIGKKAEAAKGIQKLFLLLVRADIDPLTGAISNVALAEPSKGMQLVISNERSAQASAFSDVLRKGFGIVKQDNVTDIRSREMSLKNLSKAVAGHLLLGNLSTVSITGIQAEPNSIDITAFYPQRNQNMIDADLRHDLASRMEEGLDVAEAHRAKTGTSMKVIGKVADVKDVTSLLINVSTVIAVITSSDKPQPLLHTMLSKIMTWTIDSNWEEHMTACGGSIPNVHLLLLSYVDRIWVCFAKFALDFNNINVVTENRPLADLDLSEINKAVSVYLALGEELRRAQAQGVQLLVPPQLVSRFAATGATPSPQTPQAGKAVVTPPAQNKRKIGDIQAPPNALESPAKKPRRSASSTEASGYVKKEMGMFHLKYPEKGGADNFPPGVRDRICVDFTCKGRECKNPNCTTSMHPRRPQNMKREDVEAIAKHFKDKDIGWLSAYHFAELGMSPLADSLMGDDQGISTRPR